MKFDATIRHTDGMDVCGMSIYVAASITLPPGGQQYEPTNAECIEIADMLRDWYANRFGLPAAQLAELHVTRQEVVLP